MREMNSVNEYDIVRQLSDKTSLVFAPSLKKHLVVRRFSFQQSQLGEINKKLERFRTIEHPSILRIHECTVQETGIIRFVEEYCEEGRLTNRVNWQSNIASIMQTIAEAIEYLHCKKHLMHGRLRINNIFSRNGVIVVGGLYTSMLSLIGNKQIELETPEASEGIYGYASDVWMLGALFYQLAVTDWDNVTTSEQREPCVSETSLEKIADKALQNLIRQMLQTNPCERPSITEVLKRFFFTVNQPTPQSHISRLRTLYLQNAWQFKCSEEKLKSQQIVCRGLIEEEAEKGSAQAMFLLGKIYYETDNTESLPKAKHWLHRAAEAGEYLAYLRLFYYYQDKEKHIDFELLRKGYQLGDHRCLWKEARYYACGFEGVAVDHKRALQMMKEVPEDFALVPFQIVRLTEEIESTRASLRAYLINLVVRGSELGDRRSIEFLSDARAGQSKNKEAVKLGLIASAMKDGHCIGNIHQLYNGNGIYCLRLFDRLVAASWLKRAEDGGSKAAGKNMAQGYLFK